MLFISGRIQTELTIQSKKNPILLFGFTLLLIVTLSLSQVWNPSILQSLPLPYPTVSQQKIDSFLLNYSNLSEPESRHSAYRDLKKLLQQHQIVAQDIEQRILLNQHSSIELLAVTAGVLSSYGTPKSQQALCNALQGFLDNENKTMILLPQIMLLEKPESFLFEELRAFIRKSRVPSLRENAELTLAGLSQYAQENNPFLAHRITQWLENKKSTLPKTSESLANFIDLLGNTGNEVFLTDILKATTHADFRVRSRAAFALRLFNKEQVFSSLKQLTHDQEIEVKTKAHDALRYFIATQSDS